MTTTLKRLQRLHGWLCSRMVMNFSFMEPLLPLVFGELFLSTNRLCYRWNFGGLCPVCRWLLARPLGGLVFGHYGDKIGRKKLLQISLIIVGITTF